MICIYCFLTDDDNHFAQKRNKELQNYPGTFISFTLLTFSPLCFLFANPQCWGFYGHLHQLLSSIHKQWNYKWQILTLYVKNYVIIYLGYGARTYDVGSNRAMQLRFIVHNPFAGKKELVVLKFSVLYKI